MSRVGDDLVEAFGEIAAYLRGEAEVESYEVPSDILTADRIRAIRRSVASSTKTFEAEFHIRLARSNPTSRGAGSPMRQRSCCFAS
jgi:putative transcriptional regulator